jgi:thioesterase domain-containing protein/acyl carrier protein
MVKISGRLVEPAETEAALRRTPGIRNSVVLVRRLASGRAQLVAHLETDDGLSAGAVLRSLRDGLPAHLVPALLVRHDRLPITDRGKVDRAALLAQPPRPWRDDTSDAAEDMLTASVVGMSRRLLELDDIGPDDNLFDLGLDSLAAIEMIAMINESTGIALDPHDFFVAETPRRIAECLQRPSTSSDPDTVILHADAPGTPVFFVAGAGGFALSYRTLALELGPAQPFVVFQQHGLTQRGRREGSIAANSRRHLLALRRIRPTGPYVLAGHSWGGLVAHEMARHLAEAGEDVRLVLLDAHKPPRRLVRVRPEALRDRQTGWPLHVAKLARWRLALATRRVGDRFAKVGTARRYDAFFRLGERRMVGTTVPALAIPVLFLCAETGRPSDWDDHPQCSVRRVPGDHLTLLQPPNAAVTAAAMRSALALSP